MFGDSWFDPELGIHVFFLHVHVKLDKPDKRPQFLMKHENVASQKGDPDEFLGK